MSHGIFENVADWGKVLIVRERKKERERGGGRGERGEGRERKAGERVK